MFGGRKPQTPEKSTQSIPQVTGATPAPNNLPRPPVGFESVLGASSSLQGDIHSRANIRIDGVLDGAIEVEGNLYVGETARIVANIHAHQITIAGAVRGNVNGQRIQLLRTGRVWGDLSAAMIVTEEGAFVDGKLTMTAHPASKGFDHQLPAPELSVVHPSAEDANSGEPVEVEMMDDHTPTDLSG